MVETDALCANPREIVEPPVRAPATGVKDPAMQVLVIDNFDSFTFNLVQVLGALGAKLTVVRSDVALESTELQDEYDRVLISPGPGGPADAGISIGMVRRAIERRIPTLGVCLGHQCVAATLGARIVHARRPVHGKTSLVQNDGLGVFYRLPKTITVARYHSLVVDPATLPPELVISARTTDGEIMGLRHTGAPIEGVQFHPESFMTPHGVALLRNFLEGRVGDAA